MRQLASRWLFAALLLSGSQWAYACSITDFLGFWELQWDIDGMDTGQCPVNYLQISGNIRQRQGEAACNVWGADGNMLPALGIAGSFAVNRACSVSATLTDSDGRNFHLQGRIMRSGLQMSLVGYVEGVDLMRKVTARLIQHPF